MERQRVRQGDSYIQPYNFVCKGIIMNIIIFFDKYISNTSTQMKT